VIHELVNAQPRECLWVLKVNLCGCEVFAVYQQFRACEHHDVRERAEDSVDGVRDGKGCNERQGLQHARYEHSIVVASIYKRLGRGVLAKA
jgi:hypothetical protein